MVVSHRVSFGAVSGRFSHRFGTPTQQDFTNPPGGVGHDSHVIRPPRRCVILAVHRVSGSHSKGVSSCSTLDSERPSPQAPIFTLP